MYLSQRMVEGGQKEAIKSSKSFYPRSSNCASKTVVRRAIIKIYLAITNRRPVCQSKEPSRGREKKESKEEERSKLNRQCSNLIRIFFDMRAEEQLLCLLLLREWLEGVGSVV